MLNVKRIKKKFQPDYSRVIIKPHVPKGKDRIEKIIMRVLSLPEENVKQILDSVITSFSDRHKNIWDAFDKNYNEIKKYIPQNAQISNNRRALLGAYFSSEYSIQAAAFFNPSIIAHPDQSDLPKGSLRFILSFRSVGEGHISSIEFRSGIVDENCKFTFDKVSRYAERANIASNPVYDKNTFFLKLAEMQKPEKIISQQVSDLLSEEFLLSDLVAALHIVINSEHKDIGENMIWLAKSNYELQFKLDQELSEKIIFPASQNDSNGIEDARFVRFIDDEGIVTYYATYTAYNGRRILPQILETKDFLTFKMSTLNGKFSKNKGMALFPRKINGKYMMISRVDGENLYLMSSENIHFWQNAKLLKEPENAWEFVQIGNCGSPIETDQGWILLTHGVGPMREYCIGIILLDLENPNKIIGSMVKPLIIPTQDEREGYVPNVVYSCGSIIHNDDLIIPYAMSDTCSGIATISVSELFNNIQKRK
ncbi:MAG: glycoside hydrolase family 130 protein [Candidatus Gastranaerophilales bacterium]|nr:glycoside hydrolase family 130 protein [Candidatus Gastranaerophilales bacterium]